MHTPGPWHTDGVVVWASDDGGQSFDVPVCVMTSRTKNNGLTTPAENAPTCGLGNADLISAVPDLLEALRETTAGLVAIGKSRGPVHPLTPQDMVEQQNAAMAELLRLVDKAHAALAKAEGR